MLRYQNSYKGVWLSLSHMCCAVLSRSVVSDSCDPMDYSPPGFSVHGISQARILELSVISFSRGDLRNPGIKPGSPALQADSLPIELLGNPITHRVWLNSILMTKHFHHLTLPPFPDSVIVTSEACCAQPPSATQGSLPPLSWAGTCRSLSHSTEIVEAESVLDTVCIWLTDFEINIEFHMFSSFDPNPCL